MSGKPRHMVLRKSEVGDMARARLSPVLSSVGLRLHDEQQYFKLIDELLLGIVLERSGLGRALYLDAIVYPLYAPLVSPALPGTLGGRSNYLFPTTPGRFEMETKEELAVSVEQITCVCHDCLVPLLDGLRSSRELLECSLSSDAHIAFRQDDKSWHYCFLMGFVAAYCSEYDRARAFFVQSRKGLQNCYEPHDDARRREMDKVESLLDDTAELRRHLATNAYRSRDILKLPFAFDPIPYDLELGWQSSDVDRN